MPCGLFLLNTHLYFPKWQQAGEGCCLIEKLSPILLQPRELWPTTLLSMGFSRQEYEVGCHFLLQGTFPSQRLNLCFLHWQVVPLPLSHLGSPGWGGSISLNITEITELNSATCSSTPSLSSSLQHTVLSLFLSYWPSRNGLSNNVATSYLWLLREH